MRRSFSGKRAGEHWGQLGKILKTRPAWWNSVLKINLHWICLNKFATPTSRMYRNKNTTASACTFFFCHYFWFLAYRWTQNTQVCVKTQVFFFFFFLQYILIKNGLLVFRSGDHEFESRWCYSHRWLGRNEAKLGVLSGWEGCYSLCWSIVHICELIHCMCWRVDRSFLRVCYTTMWRSRSRSKRCCGWLHISWRKCVLAFTFSGW